MRTLYSNRLALRVFRPSYRGAFTRTSDYSRGVITHINRPFSITSKTYNTASSNLMNDKVHIEKLDVNAVIGADSWNQLNAQQCFVTMNMLTDFSKAAVGDDLNYSLNYAVISRDIAEFVQSKRNWRSLGNLSRSVSNYALQKYSGIESLQLLIETKTGHIRSDSISCLVNQMNSRAPTRQKDVYDVIQISNIKMLTLIGVFTFERLQKQYVTLDIRLPWPKDLVNHASYKSIIESAVSHVENSNFLTVEALVESTAKVIASNPYFRKNNKLPIELKVIKLNAITNTTGVGVSIIKTPQELDSIPLPHVLETKTTSSALFAGNQENDIISNTYPKAWSTAFIAFGSNMGNKVENIQKALDYLNASENVEIRKVSSLFESEPMYFEDQDVFMNGCVEIVTKLTPHELLKLCKDIEYKELGRIKHFDNCPRVVDLDIIMFYDKDGSQVILNTKDLIIPHPKLLERSFVLEPLCELLPPDITHPLTTEPLTDHLNQIYDQGNEADVLWKIIPLQPRSSNFRALKFMNVKMTDEILRSKVITKSPALLMGILNVTPDSFSDGNKQYLNLQKQIETVKIMCSDALRLQDKIIIDVGGCSTRPNSSQVSEMEELERTIPVIKSIRTCKDLPQENIIISIDTYRAKVAQEAIIAGADIVNDISGGTFDSDMFGVIASHPNVAYVLSHTRGNISSMIDLNKYEQPNSNVKEYMNGEKISGRSAILLRSIAHELSERYAQAIGEGIRRWQLILDPGLGFAKNGKQNLEIIRQLDLLKNYACILESGEFVNFKNIPILVGPSRKAFIGKITKDDDPKDRDFATASVISSCIGFGADIVRVHNVVDCSKTIKIANTLYRDA
ncbi:hypothetical protein HG535_0A01220 [Zygotorulaspora mrakii]|uniref:Pterin-binding domain-containing protein n=1 Tax=Zygotorulaspora mrakii TaxID=42260 RepID=A0A7H9AVJ0_ZYGMR|nr:uncharacterized protein HG535_0A01220 [Zygotorulaspora mrakii]QLG70183.1 hypothetical protein HG535_0A01220 [Zygotorulaspora mrakii]